MPKAAEAKRQKIKIGENRSGLPGKLVGLGSKKDKETIDVKAGDSRMQSTAAHGSVCSRPIPPPSPGGGFFQLKLFQKSKERILLWDAL
ncbi:MAG TPA: hypothetical protein VE954_10750 [Oligoflexus sp.]|uniref:hypothetical protein n=1 Tax=Oligoflexus sp. TaxID=1971216 RepID=UPI002D35B71E|nr:hypothetical protein [Oligoflexus sp.]HYX33583.1 hypothetical protein [Oligoflexus sp.]